MVRLACNEVMVQQGLLKNLEHPVQSQDVCQSRIEKVPVQRNFGEQDPACFQATVELWMEIPA